REGVVRAAITKVRRQRAAHRVEAPEGLLGLEDAGGAGADEDADAGGAVAGGAARHRRREAVLAQGEERQAVVATLERRERRGQRRGVDAGHLADAQRERRHRGSATKSTLANGVPALIGSERLVKPRRASSSSQARSGRHCSRGQRPRRTTATVCSTALLSANLTPASASPTRSSSRP